MTPQCPHCLHDVPDDAVVCGDCGGTVVAPGQTSLTKSFRMPVENSHSPGTIIAEKYTIRREVGRGGMGVVYEAEDTQLKRIIALKFMSHGLAVDPANKRRFSQEARTASALNHPNICTIYEVGEAGGDPYIAMEYVEGRPLDTLIPQQGLPADEVRRTAIQIAGGIQHAHERNIVHRDLKTSNVVITPEGRAKILDFGLAKRIEGSELDQVTLSRMSLTAEGSIAGTLPYLAPELLHGNPADARSDIWALGVVLYQMVSGKLPFEGRTGFALTTSILRDTPAPLPPGAPADLRNITRKCLEKEPGKRFQTASEVRTALETMVGPKDPGPSGVSSTVRLRWRRRILAAASLCLAGIVILIVAPKSGPKRAVEKGQPAVSTGARASLNPDANEYFEKGLLFLMAQFDLPKAQDMLKKALEFDSKFAEARAWYGFTFVLEIDSGFSNDTNRLYKAEEELRRALQDDPNSARAHSGLSAVYFDQGRKELAFEEAKRALAIDPNEVDASIWLANYHASNGDYTSAKGLLQQLLQRDPLFFPARMNLGDILRVEGDIAGAEREQRKILEQDPGNVYASQELARAMMDGNDLAGARRILEGLSSGDQESYKIRLTWSLLLALEGKTREALSKMDNDSQKYGALSLWTTYVVAEIYAVVGEPEKALDWLERAVRNGDERDGWFRRDPFLAKIRSLPRFGQILDSIDYKRQTRKGLKDPGAGLAP
jgi:serine/threonine protein kinase/tetratricopeptide (TPR) repeat protein